MSAATLELDPRGFLRATFQLHDETSLEDARQSVAKALELSRGARVRMLVDLRGVKFQSKEARDYFAGPEGGRVTAAVALLLGSPVSRMIGNFLLKRQTQAVPTRLFTDEGQAIAWLQGLPA